MGNKAGSVWNINLIDLNLSFDKSFTVNLGCNSSQWGGADGMVFALQPLNTSIGSSGGQMGLGGVSPSLGIYIDTYQNTAHGDMFNDHISINLNGDVIHSSSNNIAGPFDLGEVENCVPEPLRITWDPITTLMNVYYNNILVLSHTGDIINNVFNGNSMVYWGFTASTGGASNFHQFCIDVPDLIIDSTNMVIEGEKCDQENGSILGLSILGGIQPYSWTWNNMNSLSLDTFNLIGGNYSLQISDGMGCLTSHNFNIPDLSGPIIDTSNLNLKNEDCGQGNGSISNISVMSNADSIQFFWNNFLHDSVHIENLVSNNYQLIVIDNFNCSDTMDFIIKDTNYHNISVGYNYNLLEAAEPINFFQISNDSSFVNFWTFGDDSTSTDYEPDHTYKYAGKYTICLEAANEFNCYDTNCIEIQILPAEIIIPNIFSPNYDQNNDEFIIEGINDRYEIAIFNRWGNLIFSQNPYLNNWKGLNLSGGVVNEGLYYFVLKSSIENIKISGKIMIVK
jgi:gliding motility-associated-like protein